jgi:hypothetical protein
MRFLIRKQPERFRTALIAVLADRLSQEEAAPDGRRHLTRTLNWMLHQRIVAGVVESTSGVDVSRLRPLDALRFLASPYKYSFKPPISDATYGFVAGRTYDPKSDPGWSDIYSWNSGKGEATARAALRRFATYVKARRIPTLVVNMPERDLSRVRYDQASYDAYVDMVRGELGGIPFVDLRTFLGTADFFDREHTTTEGSIRLTSEVIRLTRERIAPPQQINASAGY